MRSQAELAAKKEKDEKDAAKLAKRKQRDPSEFFPPCLPPNVLIYHATLYPALSCRFLLCLHVSIQSLSVSLTPMTLYRQ